MGEQAYAAPVSSALKQRKRQWWVQTKTGSARPCCRKSKQCLKLGLTRGFVPIGVSKRSSYPRHSLRAQLRHPTFGYAHNGADFLLIKVLLELQRSEVHTSELQSLN